MAETLADTAKTEQSAGQIEVTPEMLEAMRQGDMDNRWLEEHPEALEPYRGEWVVVHNKRVVAHSRDGREAARAGNVHRYPGGSLFYVPTREESEAIRI
ncbi:MAG: DUF5678 domain-containing protein [Chloroflexota bacterium]